MGFVIERYNNQWELSIQPAINVSMKYPASFLRSRNPIEDYCPFQLTATPRRWIDQRGTVHRIISLK